jgi:hypothetical protein
MIQYFYVLFVGKHQIDGSFDDVQHWERILQKSGEFRST